MTTLPTRAPASPPATSRPARRLPAPDRPATDTDTATGVTYVQATCSCWWNQDHHLLQDRGDRLLLWCPKCEHEHEVAT